MQTDLRRTCKPLNESYCISTLENSNGSVCGEMTSPGGARSLTATALSSIHLHSFLRNWLVQIVGCLIIVDVSGATSGIFSLGCLRGSHKDLVTNPLHYLDEI